MTEELLQHQEDGIVTLTLNRPELRNSISSPVLIEALIAAFERINGDKSVKVAILTGSGSAFCSGGDLNNMHRMLDQRAAEPLATVDYYSGGIQRVSLALDNLQVPIIAAVNGAAVGAGLDLACMCDIRFAAASAKFAENYVRLGLVAGTGGFWFLPRVIGYAKACELALTGNMIKADQALQLGLVAQVHADGELMTAVNALAASIAASPVNALRMAKRLMKDSQRTTLKEHLSTVTMMQSLLHTGKHHRDAVTGFVEKRKPGTA